MTDPDERPEDKLDRLLQRERRKAALFWGSVGVIFLAFMTVTFVLERVPQGPEVAVVQSRSQSASDDSVRIDYRLLLDSGTYHVLRASPAQGLTVGAQVCVQRLRHPLFGGDKLQRLTDKRCPDLAPHSN